MRFNEFKLISELVNTQPTRPPRPDESKPAEKQTVANSNFELTVPENKYISTEIVDLQKALTALGYGQLLGTSGNNKDGIDGVRGPYTRNAIRSFQTDHSLKVDGDPGPETITAINTALANAPDIKINKGSESDIPKTVRNLVGKGKVTSVTDKDVSDIDDSSFTDKLKLIAHKLGVSYHDLYAIIKTETQGTFSPSSLFKSKDSNFRAGGLVGFTEKTAQGLGTSLDELLQMSAVEQLDYVYKMYKKLNVKPGMNRGDIYMLQFMPAYASHPDQTVLGQKHGGTLPGTGLSMHKIWDQNPLFSKGRRKEYFTVGDVKNTINSRA
jgi:peptidoglycan hydrolase-like protein with peptidoglycan-binding domain